MRTRARAGFTLVELLVALALLGMVLTAVFATILKTLRETARQQNVVYAQNSVRDAETIITTVLRMAGADPMSSGLALLDHNPLGHAVFDNIRAVADFNPVDKDVKDPLEDVQVYVENSTLMVRWQENTVAQPVAYPIESLHFAYYASNGTLITNEAEIAGATRVKMTIVAPHSPYTTTLERRESWVYLRNRR